MKLSSFNFVTILFLITSLTIVNAQSIKWLDNLGWRSEAYDVSQDGNVVVGWSTLIDGGYAHAFRWTAAGGMQDLGTLDNYRSSVARAVSGDGSIVVGQVGSDSTGAGIADQAFIWSSSSGMQYLVPNVYSSQVLDISSDGSTVIGYMILKINGNNFYHPFRWTASGGIEDLFSLIGDAEPFGISDDGSVLVGVDSTGKSAFRFDGNNLETKTLTGYDAWARSVSGDGLVTFGDLNSLGQISLFSWDSVMTFRGNIGFGAVISKASYDGSAVVGTLNLKSYYDSNYLRAFRWTKNVGVENLNTAYASLLTSGSMLKYAYSITGDKRFIVGGGINGTTGQLEAYIIDTQVQLHITQPNSISKFIVGELDTIKWIGGQSGQTLQIEYSTDNGNNWFEVGYPSGTDGQYIWEVPENILTTKAKIKITDTRNTPNSDESDYFKIKPYILTRIDSSGDYYEFRKNRDQWNFWNWQPDMWPQPWYQQFKYRGIDPFTGSQYSQIQGKGIFAQAQDFYFPDWVSWVRTFGVDKCYHSTSQRIYNINALLKWRSLPIKKGWNGSCFGIAGTNALAYRYKDLFLNRFPGFPSFTDPITVNSSDNVKRVANEIFTHQFGFFSMINDTVSSNKTPVQTLNELKELLLEDNATIRTISIINQNPSNQNPPGGHTILAYALEQDTSQGNLFYVKVYDNSKPLSNNPITIDIFANGGNGSWSTPDWPNWGGSKGLYLEVPSEYYLNNENLYKKNNADSPFILAQTQLEINNPDQSNIKIIDSQGNETSYENGAIINNIPGAKPKIIKNGSSMPPYGYLLQKDNYSLILKDFVQDTVSTFFFTGNKSFMYERSGAYNEQFDNLYFDGGLEVSNNNSENKTTTLLNLISEGTQEKLFIASSIDLNVYSSVKIENPDSNTVKITSTFLDDIYDVELNYVTDAKLDRFIAKDIWLPANASQTFVPEWTDLSNNDLKVLIDFDNDGTIDDSLYLQNQFTDVKDHGGLLLPAEFNLAQNYPNPFNPTTTIQYSIPKSVNVEIKVYDVLGNEVTTLVNVEKPAGVYEVEFNAKNLSSGVYFYKLTAGSFTETKKMTLLK